MRRGRWAGAIAAVMLLSFTVLLSGCTGQGDREQETGVKIGKNGEITAIIAEPFEKEYYTEEGLSQMILAETETYGEGRVSLLGIDQMEEAGKVIVTMQYGSAADYAAFNEVTFFYGTVEQAQAEGYSPDTALVNEKGESIQGGEDALSGKHVVIFSETMLVTVPTKVLYRSGGSTLVDSKCVRAAEDGGLTYVIIK